MIQFLKRAAATVTAALPNKVKLFIDTDGLPKTKDENNILKVLGNGIESIMLVNTTGLNKNYRITLDDGSTFDYSVADGRSIVNISLFATNGLIKTYRISFNDNTTFDFNVRDGMDGQGSPAVNNPSKIDPDDPASIGTVTNRYALEDHQHQIVTEAPVALGASNQEGTSTSFSRADHVHINPVIAHEAAVDPHPQYTTTAEASAAAPVQNFNGRTGSIAPQQADYDQFFLTPNEGDAAYEPKNANIQAHIASTNNPHNVTKAQVLLGNVINPVIPRAITVTNQTLTTTLANILTTTIPANTLQVGDTFEFNVFFSTLVNTTAASTLEVALFINGVQHYITSVTMGTTAVAAPGRGGRHQGRLVFRTVGAAGSMMGNGTSHINNLGNFASNTAAPVTVNTTANITLELRARSSAATTTGQVQFVEIKQSV